MTNSYESMTVAERDELAMLAAIRSVGFSEYNIIPVAGYSSGLPFDYAKAARAAAMLCAGSVHPMLKAAAGNGNRLLVRIAQDATDALIRSTTDTLICLGEDAKKDINSRASKMWVATL